METSEIQKELAKEFAVGELKFFPVALTQDKKKGKVGSYIDARAVMDRLDSVVGVGGWTTAYRCIDPGDKAVECTLRVRYGDEWVEKADVGYPNEAKDANNAAKEPWKAAYSDALKRAAVQHGIGRYIYDLQLEQDWLPVDEWGKFTQQPRIRGTTAQGGGAANGVPPANEAERRTPPAPSPSKPTFMQFMVGLGFAADEVLGVAHDLFDSNDPNKLGIEQKKRVQLALEERKKKEAAA